MPTPLPHLGIAETLVFFAILILIYGCYRLGPFGRR
jgi:hypothetical protein